MANIENLTPKSHETGKLQKRIQVAEGIAIQQISKPNDSAGDVTGLEAISGLSEPVLEKKDSNKSIEKDEEEKEAKKKEKREKSTKHQFAHVESKTKSKSKAKAKLELEVDAKVKSYRKAKAKADADAKAEAAETDAALDKVKAALDTAIPKESAYFPKKDAIDTILPFVGGLTKEDLLKRYGKEKLNNIKWTNPIEPEKKEDPSEKELSKMTDEEKKAHAAHKE